MASEKEDETNYQEKHRVPDYHMARKPKWATEEEKTEVKKSEGPGFFGNLLGSVARIPVILVLALPLIAIFSIMFIRKEGSSFSMTGYMVAVPSASSGNTYIIIGMLALGFVFLLPWSVMISRFDNWLHGIEE